MQHRRLPLREIKAMAHHGDLLRCLCPGHQRIHRQTERGSHGRDMLKRRKPFAPHQA